MCLVTVVDRKNNSKKKFFVNDTRANVSSLIQQTLGSFEDIYIEDLHRKDTHNLIAMLLGERMQKPQETTPGFVPQRKIYPEFNPQEWKNR